MIVVFPTARDSQIFCFSSAQDVFDQMTMALEAWSRTVAPLAKA